MNNPEAPKGAQEENLCCYAPNEGDPICGRNEDLRDTDFGKLCPEHFDLTLSLVEKSWAEVRPAAVPDPIPGEQPLHCESTDKCLSCKHQRYSHNDEQPALGCNVHDSQGAPCGCRKFIPREQGLEGEPEIQEILEEAAAVFLLKQNEWRKKGNPMGAATHYQKLAERTRSLKAALRAGGGTQPRCKNCAQFRAMHRDWKWCVGLILERRNAFFEPIEGLSHSSGSAAIEGIQEVRIDTGAGRVASDSVIGSAEGKAGDAPVEDVAKMIWSFNIENRPMKHQDQVNIWSEEDESVKHKYRLIAELAVKITLKSQLSSGREIREKLAAGFRHGDYDSEYRDGWNAGLDWIKSLLPPMEEKG